MRSFKNSEANEISIEPSSGNAFADLGLPNADQLKTKSGLVMEIARAIRRLGLTQEEAGRRMGIPKPKSPTSCAATSLTSRSANSWIASIASATT
jgi:predicted XRE-type DNA-binding protein